MSNGALDPEMTAGFMDEAGLYIAVLNERLLAIEGGVAGESVVDEMFRAAHSMKGAAGFLNLSDVCDVTHRMETVLDQIRKGSKAFSDSIVDALFQAFDCVSGLLAEIAAGEHGQVDTAPALHALERVLGDSAPPPPAAVAQPARAKDSAVEHLGELPDWLQGRLCEIDLCEVIVAQAAEQRIYALYLPVAQVFSKYLDLPALLRDVAERVQVQCVLPVIGGQDSPWRPLHSYSCDLAVLCFSIEPIATALADCALPPCQAWPLGAAVSEREPVTLGRETGKPVARVQGELRIKPEMDKHRSVFIDETREDLDQLDAELLAYEQAPESTENLHALFRCMHRLKGSCGTMGLAEMARVAHNCETMLADHREAGTKPNDVGFRLLFMTRDFLGLCLNRLEAGESAAPDAEDLDQALAQALAHVATPETAMSEWEPPAAAVQAAAQAVASGRSNYRVQIRLHPKTPMADLRYGMIFHQLADLCLVHAAQPDLHELERGLDNPPPLQLLISSNMQQDELVEMLHYDQVEQVLVQAIQCRPAASDAARGVPTAGGAVRALPAQGDTVRVDTARLDQMMNIAGELVITKARVSQQSEELTRYLTALDLRVLEGALSTAQISTDRRRRLTESLRFLAQAQDVGASLRESAQELHRHTGQLQNAVMQARMVPIGPLFQRFHRLIRDLCKERDHQARLVTAGESTELDKKLIDELADPLTHLIRNGVDHGLESPADREAAGKEGQGTLHLEAFHEGGQICIRVADDGRGLDLEKIRAKAVAGGLLSADAAARLSDSEAGQLIFEPGFSTAAKVTNISGRGVGMDIVRSKVQELKGTIGIESEPGRGTTFTIRLPLTLAMIEALLVRIGQTRYAFPLESVREIVDVHPGEISSVEGGGRMITVRERVIALIDLEQAIGTDTLRQSTGTMRAVITKGVRQSLAVLVDQVLGDEEIVVKALSEEFDQVQGIAGATVLGDGGIALILDVTGIDRVLTRSRRESVSERQATVLKEGKA